jgi:hypothetical protein
MEGTLKIQKTSREIQKTLHPPNSLDIGPKSTQAGNVNKPNGLLSRKIQKPGTEYKKRAADGAAALDS